MISPILRIATAFMLPLLLLLSVFLLVRGHDHPGGGFIGALAAVSGFGLHALAVGPEAARRALRLSLRRLIGGGLVIAVGTGCLALVAGQPFLTGRWTELMVPLAGRITVGTPLAFDVAVYMVVVGVALTIILNLAEQ